MITRALTPADAPDVETFLSRHRDSSMFLRSNIRQAGLEYTGDFGSANYVGAFEDGTLAGLAGHAWNDMLLCQAPRHAAELARACVAQSGRSVRGLTGPTSQVAAARHALELDNVKAVLDGSESLYALQLSDLVVPEILKSAAVTCRPPRADERATLCAWRLAYDIETLGASDSEETRSRSAEFLDAQIAADNAWVALSDDRLVSLSAFNAVLPDIVQLGGIYTPPELRGRGYARAAVAYSLLVARERGASRAVLFTNNSSAARSYESVGFQRIGDYALILFV